MRYAVKPLTNGNSGGIMKVGFYRPTIDSPMIDPMPAEQFLKIQKAFEKMEEYFGLI